MLDIFIDSLLDSLKILLIVFIFNLILSFFEAHISSLFEKNKKLSPLFGSLIGLIPQCGFSVLASDLYLKRHITIGTLIAVFISCSDEALPILFTSINKLPYAFLLIGLKFILGFIVGFLVDVIYTNSKKEVHDHQEHCHHHKEIQKGCCHHEINNENEKPLHAHLLHPLIHSLKIFIYVFIITFIFGIILYYIGEENVINFLTNNKYLSPLFSIIIGLIPNCASSVLIANLYILNAIPFSACLSGLMVNAGLGTFLLLKNKGHRKDALIIFGILILASLLAGYGFIFIRG